MRGSVFVTRVFEKGYSLRTPHTRVVATKESGSPPANRASAQIEPTLQSVVLVKTASQEGGWINTCETGTKATREARSCNPQIKSAEIVSARSRPTIMTAPSCPALNAA